MWEHMNENEKDTQIQTTDNQQTQKPATPNPADGQNQQQPATDQKTDNTDVMAELAASATFLHSVQRNLIQSRPIQISLSQFKIGWIKIRPFLPVLKTQCVFKIATVL